MSAGFSRVAPPSLTTNFTRAPPLPASHTSGSYSEPPGLQRLLEDCPNKRRSLLVSHQAKVEIRCRNSWCAPNTESVAAACQRVERADYRQKTSDSSAVLPREFSAQQTSHKWLKEFPGVWAAGAA